MWLAITVVVWVVVGVTAVLVVTAGLIKANR